jgi:hypothetical protein
MSAAIGAGISVASRLHDMKLVANSRKEKHKKAAFAKRKLLWW